MTSFIAVDLTLEQPSGNTSFIYFFLHEILFTTLWELRTYCEESKQLWFYFRVKGNHIRSDHARGTAQRARFDMYGRAL